MKRILAIAVVLGACVAAVVLTGASSGGGSSKKTVHVVFDNAFGLANGGDFRIGGVKAGKTTGFGVSDTNPPHAIVEAQITQPGFTRLNSDAHCDVRQQSLIGEYYVDCQPGVSKKPLKDNIVPVTQTSSPVPADLLNDVMRRPYRERFRIILNELGTGLAGRPQDLNAVIRRAAPGLRETRQVLEILGRQNRIIKDFVTNSDTVVSQLEARKRDVARWVVEAGKTAAISATRRQALRQQFQKLPTFLGELQPTMAKLGDLADQQTPLLEDLQRAAPDLNTFFDRLGPFSNASRPAVKSLGDMSKTGRVALSDSKQEVRQLAKLAAFAPSMAKPLRQFLQTFDDRTRSVQPDPRAKQTAPPAPDKTAYTNDKQGFTGFEAIWNYVFWQTLAINPYDDISHILRVNAIIGSPCAQYRTGGDYKEHKDIYDKCNTWLGPYQPGITAPDPTDKGHYSASGDPQASSANKDRGGPTSDKPPPGQPDVSKPQIALPPEVQKLLQGLQQGSVAPRAPAGAPSVQVPQSSSPSTGNQSADQLLNFLMSP